MLHILSTKMQSLLFYLVSEIPKSSNIFYTETMEETLQYLINNFEGKPDQENKGKTFKFNFLPDFILNTIQKKSLSLLFAILSPYLID